MLLFILGDKLQWKERDVSIRCLFMEGLLLKRLLNHIQCTTEASKRGFRDLKFACRHRYTLCEQMAAIPEEVIRLPKRGKKQSAHVGSDKREWDEMAAGGSDGPKMGSKPPRMKFLSRGVRCPAALGNTLGKV